MRENLELTRMLDCAMVRDRLSLFPSGDLPRIEDVAVREHLVGCRGCRRELRSWLDARAAFRSATGPEVVPHCGLRPDDAFFAELQRSVLQRVADDRARPRSPWLARGVAAAALFAVGLAIATSYPRGGLLGLDPIADPLPIRSVPGSATRPVSGRSWTGLRGRVLADALLQDAIADELPATQPATLPERRGR